MPDFTFVLDQSITFTGTSAATGSQGDFADLAGVEAIYDHSGGPLQIEFSGFNWDYPSGPSTMGLDLLLQINGVDQQRYRRFIPAARFDPSARRFSFLAESLQEGRHKFTFGARGVLYGGPPIRIKVEGNATLRLTQQPKLLGIYFLESVDAGSYREARTYLKIV